jgi:glutaconate CoA-transferase subunit B
LTELNEHSVADIVTVALAREVRDGDVVGVGLGTPLALCACLVARRTGAPGSQVLIGGAVSPDATLAECLRSDFAGRTPGFVQHLDTLDMAERQAMTLQFLRPAEVGPDGSTNVSRIRAGDRLIRFPGSLALADVPRLMPRVVLYHTAHEPRAFPPAVGFRTGAGGGSERGRYRSAGPTVLVTDLCVIRFGPRGPELQSVHPGVDAAAVAGATGFALAAGDPSGTEPPTEAELEALAAVDPHRLRELEFKQLRAAATERRAHA